MFNLDVDIICRKNVERLKLLVQKKPPIIKPVDTIIPIPPKGKIDTYA